MCWPKSRSGFQPDNPDAIGIYIYTRYQSDIRNETEKLGLSGHNVYMKDIQFDSKGNPIIMIVVSKGYEAGEIAKRYHL